MSKLFTRIFATLALVATMASVASAQTFWPTADTNVIKVSQFNGAGTLLRVTDSTPNALAWTSVPANYRGWITHGMQSSNPAKRDSAVWTWNANASGEGGAYYGAGSLNSPSRANGAVVFNSDFLDNRGVRGNFQNGPSPAIQFTGNHISELVSPVINATGYSSIFLQFNQLARKLNVAAFFVAYSQDSGRTWSTPININTELGGNGQTSNATVGSTFKSVKLQGAVGSTGFRVKFIFSGYYYFWIVDDVKLTNSKYDLDMTTAPFYALPQNYTTPTSQVDSIRFLADVKNNNFAMPNAKLNITVWRITRDATGIETARTVVHNADFNYGTFPADSLVENKLIPGAFVPPPVTAEYLGRYKIFGDSLDQIPSNDTVAFSFFVSDTVKNIQSTDGFPNGGIRNTINVNTNYSKDNYSGIGSIPGGGFTFTTFAPTFWPTATEPRALRLGNAFRFTKKDNTIVRMTALIRPFAMRGNTVRGALYKWVDNGDQVIQASERTLISVSDTLIPTTTSDSGSWYSFDISRITDGRPVLSTDTTTYLAMIEINNTVDVASPPQLYFTRQGYGAANQIAAQTGTTRFGMVSGRTADVEWNVGNFTNLAPVVRLFVYPFRVNTDDILSNNNTIEVFPNPNSTSTVTVRVALEKQSEAGIRITSIDGRVVSDQVAGNIQKQDITVDISALTNGTYLVQLLTQDGVKTTKLVIAH